MIHFLTLKCDNIVDNKLFICYSKFNGEKYMAISLSEDLEKVKVLLNYTNTDFSTDLNINRSTLIRWLKEENYPNKMTLNYIYSFIYSKGINLNLIDEELYKSKASSNTLILFHGSKSEITGKIKIDNINNDMDFGEGFYLTEAVNDAIRSISNFPDSLLYIIKIDNVDQLNIKKFTISIEWLFLISFFRGKLNEYTNSAYLKNLLKSIENIDIIIAPIADNSMYTIINEFIEGGITDKQCINALSANRLGKQVVILNNRTLDENVKVIKESFICTEEKRHYEMEKESDRNIGKAKMILAKRKYAGIGKYIEEILI